MSEGFKVRKSQWGSVGLEDGRRSPAKDCWQLLEAGNDEEMDSLFPAASGINTRLPTPLF